MTAMARPLRVEYAGAVYHVMARGNERRAIYRDDRDRQRFLETVVEAVAQFGLQLHAYCLMPNHYHLLVGTPAANLSRAMGWLQTTDTARFNARHRRPGHLFQGRFKAQLVDAAEYARWLVEYIHLNPVRPRQKGELIAVGRSAELTRYPWSSHRVYAGLTKPPGEWLCLDWQRYWGRSRREAHREYRAAIRRAFGQTVKNPWDKLQGGLVLGSEELMRRSEALLAQKRGLEEARWTQELAVTRVRERLDHLLMGEPDERIHIWARVRLGHERGVDMARQYGGRSQSAITLLMRRLEQRAGREKALHQKLETLRAGVKCAM